MYMLNKKIITINNKICDKFNIETTNIINKLLYVKFKIKHLFYKTIFYYHNDDDIYLIVAYDKNNNIVDYVCYDFDFYILNDDIEINNNTIDEYFFN